MRTNRFLSIIVTTAAFGLAAACARGADPLTGLRGEALTATRWDSGNTTVTNESRLDLFQAAITDRGGAYLGVGGLQNFTLAAWADSRQILLVDFTRTVVRANKVHIAFLKSAEHGGEFQNLWKRGDSDRVLASLCRAFDECRPGQLFAAYRRARPFVLRYLAESDSLKKRFGYSLFFQDTVAYARLRKLAGEGRIIALEGNLLGPTTIRSIAAALNRKEQELGVLYLSNAEEYASFRPYPKTFRDNIRSLPAAENSVVLRTISIRRREFPWAPGSGLLSENGFHYGVQDLRNMQSMLARSESSVLDAFRAGRSSRRGLTLIRPRRLVGRGALPDAGSPLR